MNDRRFYERFWSDYKTGLQAQMSIHSASRRPLHRLLQSLLPAEKSWDVLEVGCGTALDSCLLAAACPQARAVASDYAREAVQVAARNARELGLPVTVLAADLMALPFAAESFDLVFSQGVLEHFTDPQPAIREQARVLRPGGTLLVDVPQKFNLYTLRKRRAMRENRWPWGWETEYSAAELRACGGHAGLTPFAAIGHQHGRIVDRLLIHPHRTLHNKLARLGAGGNGYRPGAVARAWESLWDWLDMRIGAYTAINVAVAFRKPNGVQLV